MIWVRAAYRSPPDSQTPSNTKRSNGSTSTRLAGPTSTGVAPIADATRSGLSTYATAMPGSAVPSKADAPARAVSA